MHKKGVFFFLSWLPWYLKNTLENLSWYPVISVGQFTDCLHALRDNRIDHELLISTYLSLQHLVKTGLETTQSTSTRTPPKFTPNDPFQTMLHTPTFPNPTRTGMLPLNSLLQDQTHLSLDGRKTFSTLNVYSPNIVVTDSIAHPQ